MLRPEFLGVNQKRIFQLYQLKNLAVRRRKKLKRLISARVLLTIATQVNQVWSTDFVTLGQARSTISLWRNDYNEIRPHSSTGRIPPAPFAQTQRLEQKTVAAAPSPTTISYP
jgi:Integrase core domain